MVDSLILLSMDLPIEDLFKILLRQSMYILKSLIRFVLIFSKIAIHHFLKMIILRAELMRYIIYVDNVQQCMVL